MKKITDYTEVSPLIMRYYRRGVVTNNFLTGDDYKAEIAEGTLYCDAFDDALCVYLKRDGFYLLYFHTLTPDAPLQLCDEPIVTEAVGDARRVIEASGFTLKLERVNLDTVSEHTDAEITYADAADAPSVHALICESFDKYTGLIPTLSQIRSECERSLVYKYGIGGEVKGCLQTQRGAKNAMIRHLCVDFSLRGQGIGKKLCSAFLADNSSKTCSVWTGKTNKAALALYDSLGFKLNGRESGVYIKNLL